MSPRRATLLLGFPVLVALGAIGLGARSSGPDFGDPLPGLTPAQQALFQDGKTEFQSVEDVADGIGPVFNGTSCSGCHNAPAVGGFGTTVETRFGRLVAGRFDPMEAFGGSLIQTDGIGPQGTCNFVGETVPAGATIVAGRLTTPLFGLGLVDAVPDATFRAIAALEQLLTPAVAGRPNIVLNLATSHQVVGKFGWKSQVPTLFQFSGDAYLNEMGITSPQFPHENCPQGNCNLLACDPVPNDPEDDGEDVQRFADFMRFLAPPPRGAITPSVQVGEALFFATGCFTCHTPALQTGPNAVAALHRVTFFPFSDFLLHDMGSLGDGIEQSRATGREMRTAPLWGARGRTRFLHDGRATTLEQAILAHDGQGRFSREAFRALDASSKSKLIAFLNSI